MRSGRKTVLDTVILKFASRCNLACDYCYEYAAGDASWRAKPKLASPDVFRRLGTRISEFGEETGSRHINVVMHGGEPLLVGVKRLDRLLSCLREAARPVEIKYSLQTNGTLLSPAICDILEAHDVCVGVSLDGGPEHNVFRKDLKGRETWERVSRAIHRLRARATNLFGGLLCVVDFDTDPEAVITALCDFDPPALDLLHPFITHDMAGARRKELALRYGRWMNQAMRFWLSRPDFAHISIRVFEDALQAAVSAYPRTDWFGRRSVSLLIVETDGSYDLLDQLKVIGQSSAGVRNLKKTVFDCSLLEAERIAWGLLRDAKGDVLPSDCADCRWREICAGGHLPARYSLARGFDNKSVYCEGIGALLDLAQEVMRAPQ